MIRFICPNGHPLSAPDNRAGRAGKCPKCGTEFVVPEPEPEESPKEEMPVEEVPADDAEVPAELVDEIAAEQDDLFFFLCPNGHKLNGPPTLKGKPGQCPHCGAKFRIPADDDEDEPVEGTEQVGPFVDDLDAELVEGVELVEDQAVVVPPPARGHPLGDLLTQLWRQHGDGRAVELTLKDQHQITAEFFSATLSGPQYGVFGNDQNGEVSIVVVAWNDIGRFTLKNLPELPEDFFE